MKNFLLIILLFLSTVITINPQQNLWREIDEANINLVGNRYIIPQSYRTVNLEIREFETSA